MLYQTRHFKSNIFKKVGEAYKEDLNFSHTQAFFLVLRLSSDVDIAAVVVLEALGLVAFFIGLLFLRQFQRIREKQREYEDAQKRGVISERGDGKCHSFEWVMDNIVQKPRKLLGATPLLMASIGLLGAVVYYVILPRVFSGIISLGYAFVIALIGVLILVETDVFEAYSYTSAIRKVSTEQLDKEDRSFIELAREALKKATLRFLTIGVAFALVGPFIPQIFDGLVYALIFYTRIYFGATAAFLHIQIIGLILILALPGIMLFLPELLVRIVLRQGKSLAGRMFKRKRD